MCILVLKYINVEHAVHNKNNYPNVAFKKNQAPIIKSTTSHDLKDLGFKGTTFIVEALSPVINIY